MSEQPESNTDAKACNIGIYPYQSVRLPLKELLSRFGLRLGVDYVPVVFSWRTKGGGRFANGWTTKSWEELSAQEGYLKALTSGKWNIGIRLGPKSGGLASFDIDTSDRSVIDALLQFKPELADTLWTRSGHPLSGANIWFRMRGLWANWTLGKNEIRVPGVKSKSGDDSGAMEFRTQDGLQNIIYGERDPGSETERHDLYCVANDKPILEFDFNDFKPLIEATKALGWTGWPALPANQRARTSREEGRWRLQELGWKGKFEDRRRILEEELGYEIIDAKEEEGKVAVQCVNEEAHSRDSGEWQTIIFTGTDNRARPAYFCPHAHCKTVDESTGSSVNQEETLRIVRAFAAAETVYFRAGNARLNETYYRAYARMTETGQFFNLSKQTVQWREPWEEVLPMNAARLHPALNELDIAITQDIKGGKIGPKKLAGQDASDLLDQPTYIESYFPKIRAVAPCSIFFKSKTTLGGVLTSYGYNPEIEYLNLSRNEVQILPLERAKEFLDRFFLNQFAFESPADRARAIAALLSPALLLGHWFEGRAPAQLVVADKRQAGKTFFLKLLAAMYNHELILQEYLERSIGGVIERLQYELGRGSPFFAIDNIRGAPDLPFVEIFTTGGREVQFRGAYEKMRYADTTRMTLLLCGNEGFKITGDLASRCVITKLLYKAGRDWRLDGVSLAEMVKNQWTSYLGAIFGIISGWAKAECPRKVLSPEESGGTDMRFTDWTERLNGILHLLEEKPLTLGLAERQTRASDPNIVFAEQAFELLKTNNLLDKCGSPGAWGNYFRDSELDLPFKYDGPRSLATKIGNHFKRMPTVSENCNQYGPGFVHFKDNPATGHKSYLVSESANQPQNPSTFDYDP